MKNDILKIRPPKLYEEGIIKCEDGLDNIPELIEYLNAGYKSAEAKKMDLLVRIEKLKSLLNNLEGMTKDEVEDMKIYIDEMINNYNLL